MDLVQKLREQQDANISQELKAMNEVKLLLAHDEQQDLDILRALGKNHANARIETQTGKMVDLKNKEKEFNGEVYLIEQIKNIAIKYHLRFLPSKYFCGGYDIESTAKIKEFYNKNLGEVNLHDVSARMYILAPQEMFELEEAKVDRDPVIFYKIDETHYRLIHKWGNDLSITRRISGFMNESQDTKALATFIKWFSFFFIILSLLIFSSTCKHGNHPILAYFALIPCALVSILRAKWLIDFNDFYNKQADAENTWDDTRKYKNK